MRKIIFLGLSVCMALAVSSCKSTKQSDIKAAYDQAQQQEIVQGQSQAVDAIEIAPVSSSTSSNITVAPVDDTYREEKVVLAVGESGALKAFSVVCGSFTSKTNAEALKNTLVGEGYNALVVQNPVSGMYRVVCGSYDDKQKAAEARAQFKANHPDNADFQQSWLLYNN